MEQQTKRRADTRLARIEGQIRAIRNMIGEDQYCIDVVRQIQAARAGLSSLESFIIDDHVDSCVDQAIESGSKERSKEKVNELVSILTGRKK